MNGSAAERGYLSPDHEWLHRQLTNGAPVPCGTCHACCRGVVDMHPERGDDPRQYDCVINVDTSSANNLATLALRRVPGKDGELQCVYLDAHGKCSIYDRRPSTCREFDCRKLHAMHSRRQETRLIREGYFERAVFKAGRQRRRTLPEFAKIRDLCRRLGVGERLFQGMQIKRGFSP